MSMRFNTPVFRPQDNKGRTLPGAQLFFYENYSTTPKTTYANVALTNPNPHPIIADGAGKFTDIFLGIGDYRVILTDRKGQILWDRNDVSTNDLTEDVINDIERQLDEVLNQYRMQYLGEYGVADPELEKTFTVPNAQYVEFNGFAYWTIAGTTLPYTTDSVTYPDPASDPNLTIAPNVTFAYVDTVTNLGDSQLAGGNIWPLSSQESAQVGDAGLSNILFLRDASGGNLYKTTEVVSGEITALDFASGTATIGGVDVGLFINKVDKFGFDGWPGTLLSAIEYSSSSGSILVIDGEKTDLPSTVVSSLSGFNIEFNHGAKLTLADAVDASLLRFDSCSNFSLTGSFVCDGNKANNPGAGSSGLLATFYLVGLQDCSDFKIGDVSVINAHTGGFGLYDCLDFSLGSISSDGSREIGVSIAGSGGIDSQISENWSAISLRGDNSENNHGVRTSNTANFNVISMRGDNNFSNGCLIEIASQDATISSIKATGNGVNGGKNQDTKNITIGTIDTDNTTSFHGWGVIDSEDTTIGTLTSNNNGNSGLYVYSTSASSPTVSLTVGVLKGEGNDRGCFVEQTTGGSVLSVSIGNVDLQNNNYGYFAEDIILDSEVTISSGLIRNNTTTDVFAADGSQRPKLGLAIEVGSINYSTTSILTPDNTAPLLEKSTRNFQTANTVATVVDRLRDNDVIDKTVTIIITDANTTFANGAGDGRLIVPGGNLPVSSGDIVQATKITDSNGASYNWRLRLL